MPITHLLFDFDGTLANTNELIAQSHLATVERYYPGKYTRQSVRVFNGPSLEQVYYGLDPSLAPQMMAAYRAFNEAHHDELIQAFPEVHQTLVQLKKAGVGLAVASTKRRRQLERGLASLALTELFDFVLSGDDCQEVKPHPEIIELALSKWQVPADHVLMVGDNWQDLAAAHAAGVAAAFVEWSEKNYAELTPHTATYQIKHMSDFMNIVACTPTED